MRYHALSLGLIVGLFVCALTYADIPKTINFQGRLTDATGKFVPDGNYSLTFRLYNDSTGGTAKWAEGQLVSVSKGLFNVILGSATPIPDSIFANPKVWLGIQAGADPEMLPRQKLNSVAFAYKSLQSDTATFIKGGVDDGDWTMDGDNIYRSDGNVGIGIVPWMKLMVSDNLGVIEGSHFPFDVRSFFASGPAYAGVGLGYRANGTSATGGLIESHNALPLMLGTSNKPEALTILDDGNIGIGTNSPERNLDIFDSNPNLRLRTSSGSPTVTLDKAAGGYPGYIEFREAGASKWQAGVSTTNDYYILNWPSSEYLFYATSGGNVGIGTSNPQTRLDIQGNSSGTFNRILRLTNLNTANNNTSVIDFWSANTGASQQSYASIVGEFPSHSLGSEQGALHFYTRNGNNFTSRLSITPSGNIGIGTTSPSYVFQVKKPSPNLFVTSIENNDADGYGLEVRTANSDNTKQAFAIYTGGAQRFEITNAGNVGIGNTNATNILTVQQSSATDPIADAWTTYSSREYKRDIRELTSQEYQEALEKILSAPVVKFHYKGDDAKEKIGVIAEEAPEEILSEGNSKAISLNEYISLLHAALKAQQKEIEALKIRLEKLDTNR